MNSQKAAISESEAKESLGAIDSTRLKAQALTRAPWSLAVLMTIQWFCAVVNSSELDRPEGKIGLIGISASGLWMLCSIIWAFILRRRGVKIGFSLLPQIEKVLYVCLLIILLVTIPIGVSEVNSAESIWVAVAMSVIPFGIVVFLMRRVPLL